MTSIAVGRRSGSSVSGSESGHQTVMSTFDGTHVVYMALTDCNFLSSQLAAHCSIANVVSLSTSLISQYLLYGGLIFFIQDTPYTNHLRFGCNVFMNVDIVMQIGKKLFSHKCHLICFTILDTLV